MLILKQMDLGPEETYTLWVQKVQNHHIPMNILTKEVQKLV